MALLTTQSSLKQRIEELLPKVARPARYTGGELNAIQKPFEGAGVRVALAFPDVYEVGMSNLGLRILYHVLNSQPGTAAERVFAPASDMAAEMRSAGVPLFSLESWLPVREFDIVGFSLAYELGYTSVLDMLDLAGIPVLARERTNDDPIVIAGGHCASNPEPMAEFVDAFAIGDGEEVVLDIVREYKANRGNRSATLDALARIEGVYVPSVYNAKRVKPTIRARFVRDLDGSPFPDRPVVPFTETVHDRVTLEIMRGCCRGCRFCQAGMITRPVRERSLTLLVEQAGTILHNTGHDEIALTSLSSADYSAIDDLVRTLIDRHESDRVGISLPSLRPDAECVHLASEISRVRKSGLTFAPEAGTQRLRDVINKNVTDQDLLDAVEAAVRAGWKRVKLYFMVGLPTETDEDIEGIRRLARSVIEVGRRNNTALTLNVTVAPFVPKPHTPFQWRAMATPDELEHKISLLRSLLKDRNIELSWHDSECSRVEAALARGDRSLGRVIYEAWRLGGRLEQDNFDANRWHTAFESAGLDIARYADVEIPEDAPLPWDHIDFGVSRQFLARENERANRAETTADCRSGPCSDCGVRDRLPDGACWVPASRKAPETRRPAPETGLANPVTAVMTFRKGPELRWIGHLDLMRVFERAVRMSGIAVACSQGFNPRYRISVASALPLGATADEELLTLGLSRPESPEEMLRRLNRVLPEGLLVRDARVLSDNLKGPIVTASEFVVTLRHADPDSAAGVDAAIAAVMDCPRLEVERESGHKRRAIDIRPGIESLRVLDRPSELAVRIAFTLPHREFTVKPSEVVGALRRFAPGITSADIHRSKLHSTLLGKEVTNIVKRDHSKRGYPRDPRRVDRVGQAG